MITFSEWFQNLQRHFPQLEKKFQKRTIQKFVGGQLPTHEQAMKIADLVSNGQEIVGNLYIEQM